MNHRIPSHQERALSISISGRRNEDVCISSIPARPSLPRVYKPIICCKGCHAVTANNHLLLIWCGHNQVRILVEYNIFFMILDMYLVAMLLLSVQLCHRHLLRCWQGRQIRSHVSLWIPEGVLLGLLRTSQLLLHPVNPISFIQD